MDIFFFELVMSSAYGAQENDISLPLIPSLPFCLTSTFTPSPSLSESLYLSQVTKDDEKENEIMRNALNYEIRKGNTYPQEKEMTPSQFRSYFFSHYAFAAKTESGEIYGFFYIKPNFPGRSSHICNGGFIVLSTHQGKGVGKLMAQAYLYLARDLGFRGSFFNLVYESNVPSLRLWDRLGFTRAGRLPKAGRLLNGNGDEEYIDAIQIHYDLTTLGPTPF